jgi:selT/selW/selH-like putative selenoprotein
VAAEIEKEFGKKVVMEKRNAGEFEIIVNGKTVFSGLKEGRFPNPGEPVKLIKEYLEE